MSGVSRRKVERLTFSQVEWLMRPPDVNQHAFSGKESRVKQDVETQRFLEKRHKQLAGDWLACHTHQIETIKKDSAALIKGHLAEVRRYEAMLSIKPSSAEAPAKLQN